MGQAYDKMIPVLGGAAAAYLFTRDWRWALAGAAAGYLVYLQRAKFLADHRVTMG